MNMTRYSDRLVQRELESERPITGPCPTLLSYPCHVREQDINKPAGYTTARYESGRLRETAGSRIGWLDCRIVTCDRVEGFVTVK